MTFNDAAPKVVPTLSGHIKFAMQSFATLGAPRPAEIRMNTRMFAALREELLDEGLTHVHGMRITIDDNSDGIILR